MLGFIAFLIYAAFFIPLIRTTVRSITKGRAEEWSRWRFGILVAIGGVILISLILWGLGIYTEVLWFKELNYASVFWKMFGWQWGLFLGFGLFFFAFAKLNGWIIGRLTPPLPPEYSPPTTYFEPNWITRTRVVGWITDISLVIAAVLMGAWAKSQWNEILMFLNQVPSNIADPIFGKDISFYLFSLPVCKFLSGWILVSLLLILAMTGCLWAFHYTRTKSLYGEPDARRLLWPGLIHTSLLGLGIIATLIWRTVLAMWNLLYSERGVVFGASYTDVHAQIGAYKAYIAVLVIVAALILVSTLRRRPKLALWTGIGWFGAWLVIVIIYPAMVQQLSVKPSELAKETPYIRHNIKFTRQAYDLVKVVEKDFEAAPELTMEDIQRNRATIDNIRLWDWRALLDTYRQIQEIRLYYEFGDVDIDRYQLNGKYRQVMLAPRELPVEELPERSKTWINERFKYTHGFGLCLNSVNEFTSEGLPHLLIKDMPPVSTIPGIQITRPQIYYGEMTNQHVFVNTATEEFDYPKGDENVYTTYKGTGGVQIGSFLRKFAFAWRFDGIKVLLSDYLKPESRVMFHRNITERVQTLAPFLVYDKDPYMVIDDEGRLWWLWDAYTVSTHYPYAERYEGYPEAGSSLNYIRNSVKVSIDAYNGTVSFYIFDEQDPIVRTYQKIFPDLFKSKESMPPDLRRHIRYPEDFLSIQAKMYAIYHMQDPQVFYNKEDLWEVAKETYISNVQPVLPYYVIIRLPGEKKEEFIQMIPFTPTKKNNMIGWMAGRCDGENYGKLLVYKFPKEKLIYGPMQIEARIDQDREISARLTLWGQMGSRVIRGNLLVIPIESSLIYVEPLYLQAEKSQMPELKQIIVAHGDRLAWGRSFDEALTRVLGRYKAPEVKEVPEREAEELIKSAIEHFKRYKELTGRGRLMEAGEELEALGRDLEKLLRR